MAEKLIEILRTLAHISEKLKSLSTDIDNLYDSLSDKELVNLIFKKDKK